MANTCHKGNKIGLPKSDLGESEAPQKGNGKPHNGHADKRVRNTVVILQEVDILKELGDEIEVGRGGRNGSDHDSGQHRVGFGEEIRCDYSPCDM